MNRLRMWLGNVLVAENGGRAASYREEEGARAMASPPCAPPDFSDDYVKINAEYRS